MDNIFTDSKGNKYQVIGGVDFDANAPFESLLILEPVMSKKPERTYGKWQMMPVSDNAIGIAYRPEEGQWEVSSDTIRIAIQDAVKALLDFIYSTVDGGKPTTEKHNSYVEMSRKASEAHKLAGAPKAKKKG